MGFWGCLLLFLFRDHRMNCHTSTVFFSSCERHWRQCRFKRDFMYFVLFWEGEGSIWLKGAKSDTDTVSFPLWDDCSYLHSSTFSSRDLKYLSKLSNGNWMNAAERLRCCVLDFNNKQECWALCGDDGYSVALFWNSRHQRQQLMRGVLRRVKMRVV